MRSSDQLAYFEGLSMRSGVVDEARRPRYEYEKERELRYLGTWAVFDNITEKRLKLLAKNEILFQYSEESKEALYAAYSERVLDLVEKMKRYRSRRSRRASANADQVEDGSEAEWETVEVEDVEEISLELPQQ